MGGGAMKTHATGRLARALVNLFFVAALLAVGCQETRTHVSLRIGAETDVGPLDGLVAQAWSDNCGDGCLSNIYFKDLQGMDLSVERWLLGFEPEEHWTNVFFVGIDVFVALHGLRDDKIVATAFLKDVRWGGTEIIDVTLAMISEDCDKDGDGFRDCVKAECCIRGEDDGFADCDDDSAEAHPFAESKACRACEASCGTGEGDVDVVESGGSELQDVDVADPTLIDNGNDTVTDTKTNLIWEKTPATEHFQMCTTDIDYNTCLPENRPAEKHCKAKDGGSIGNGWRLPTVSELRSLVKDCFGTATDGTCNVSELDGGCLSWGCRDPSCTGCISGGGPGEGGRYIDNVFNNIEDAYFWSSSPHADRSDYAWYVNFDGGGVYYSHVDYAHGVRCVRSGP